jgi:hypothetical protein
LRVTVRIPDEPDYSWRTLRYAVESFTFLFGGTTVNVNRGTWLDDNWEVVYNKVWTIESYTDNEDVAEVGWEVYGIAEEAKAILQENTIMYTINDKAYFA